MKEKLAPRARFELATLRLTAELFENLTALFGVAYGDSDEFFNLSVGQLGQPPK